MTKVLYNGTYIELCDELEPGYKELDMLNPVEEKNDYLEKTIEFDPINLDDTQEFDLDDTQEYNLGDIHE